MYSPKVSPVHWHYNGSSDVGVYIGGNALFKRIPPFMVQLQEYLILIQHLKNYSVLGIVGITDYEMAPSPK